MEIKKKFSSERVVMQWHRLPREVVGSPSLGVLRNHVDMALRDVVCGHGGGGLGLDMVTLEVFFSLKGSMVLPK